MSLAPLVFLFQKYDKKLSTNALRTLSAARCVLIQLQRWEIALPPGDYFKACALLHIEKYQELLSQSFNVLPEDDAVRAKTLFHEYVLSTLKESHGSV